MPSVKLQGPIGSGGRMPLPTAQESRMQTPCRCKLKFPCGPSHPDWLAPGKSSEIEGGGVQLQEAPAHLHAALGPIHNAEAVAAVPHQLVQGLSCIRWELPGKKRALVAQRLGKAGRTQAAGVRCGR